MFQFSTKTVVNRKFRLTDLYREMDASKQARLEGKNIEEVTLMNVLSPMTLNCEKANSVKEVYVFEIKVQERVVPENFIKELDKSIKFHTLFVVRQAEWELCMISYKTGAYKGKYYQTNWETDPNFAVPLVDNVPQLYKYIISKFFKYPSMEQESVEEYIKRYNKLIKLDFQIGKTQSAILHESQSKKKFEYNARLKQYKQEREELLGEC